jgi:hypothetical protein
MNKAYFRQLNKFAKNTEISYTEMREMVLDFYEPFKVWTKKKDGSNYRPDAFTFVQTANPRYANNNPQTYMVVQVLDDNGTGSGVGFRTIILKNITKIEVGGKTYLVR